VFEITKAKAKTKASAAYGIRLLDRDIEILSAIANTQMLTINQINRLFFNNNITYGYRRLTQLKNAGYVTSKPYINRNSGQKLSTCYYLTTLGYRTIGEEHYNPSLLIKPQKHDYLVTIGEIYVNLKPHGWEWRNSVKVKDLYNFNRGDKIAGSIIRENPNSFTGKDEFGLYLVSKNPQEDTIRSIQSELIKNQQGLNSAVILHQGNNRNIVYEEGGELKEWRDHLGMYQLHIMQYDQGLNLLKLMVNPDYLLNDPFKSAWEKIGATYEGTEPTLFSKHLLRYGNVLCHLTELASNNLTAIYHLRNYSLEEARAKDRRIIALVLPGEEANWRSEFPEERYPHLRFFPVEGI